MGPNGTVINESIIGGTVWTSPDYGVTWTFNNLPAARWFAVASSADGNRLMAMGYGVAYNSADAGMTWKKMRAPIKDWSSLAASADGTQLAATSINAKQIYLSNDGGDTRKNSGAPTVSWSSVASSSDGERLIAVAGGDFSVGKIYTWQRPPPTLSITLSPDGVVLAWPISALAYRPQENFRADATNWTDVAVSVVVEDQQNRARLPLVSDNRFYRLVRSAQ